MKFILTIAMLIGMATPAFAAEPLTWMQGGWGDNVRSYGTGKCPETWTEYRPMCPENTIEYRGVMAYSPTGAAFTGDAKWYFAPMAVKPGTYRLQFDYQAYTWGAEAVAWYQMKDGTDRYVLLKLLPQKNAQAMGYVGWAREDITFTPPSGADKVTVFLSTTGRNDCGGGDIGSTCKGPTNHTLNIANIVLDAPSPDRAALLAQIATLEAEITRLRALLALI